MCVCDCVRVGDDGHQEEREIWLLLFLFFIGRWPRTHAGCLCTAASRVVIHCAALYMYLSAPLPSSRRRQRAEEWCAREAAAAAVAAAAASSAARKWCLTRITRSSNRWSRHRWCTTGGQAGPWQRPDGWSARPQGTPTTVAYTASAPRALRKQSIPTPSLSLSLSLSSLFCNSRGEHVNTLNVSSYPSKKRDQLFLLADCYRGRN